ncbi:MAG: hypothetical protein SFW36_12220 [Leptolyngbyaceae cyanobacterium bins.59]|nr:hypothetical protein [Leptolyngbyaceae cyanobacterium bins.59]
MHSEIHESSNSTSPGASGGAEVRLVLSQFRARYPSASLISDLLQMHEGHYVVRVSIHQEGTLLGTGLAAAEVLEQAEDRARLRAIEGLGISAPSSYGLAPRLEVPPLPVALEVALDGKFDQRSSLESPSKPILPGETSNLPSEGSRFVPEVKPISPPPSFTSGEPVETIVDYESFERNDFVPDDIEIYGEEKTGTSPFEFEVESPATPPKLSTAEEFRGADLYQDFTTGKPTVPEKSIPLSAPDNAPTDLPSHPIDMSDIIAQTDLEMKRAGWTRSRGRSYLIETYGKKTRQELDDDELMDFLDFLKGQPSAPS